ncbi:MAG: acyl-CoA dehydrogenase family protein [Acidimicrobiales bacterium]
MIDAEEADLVRSSMRQLLQDTAPRELPDRLLTSGWCELLDVDAAAAVNALANEQGHALVPGPGLDLVMAHAASLPLDSVSAVVLPPIRRRPSPAASMGRGRLSVDGLVLAGHERAERCFVATVDAVHEVAATALSYQPMRGSDADLGLARATGAVPARHFAQVAVGSDWERAVAAGRRFVAAELVGLTERMLSDTVAYVLARHQFGRPIASFQAVKHRLADVRVAVAAARAGIATAWAEGDPVGAMAAKCLAGRAHRLAAANCQQVHGGIAFTVEHGFHRMIRRGQVLDGLLGSADDLVVELGRHLLDTKVVPRSPQLRSPDGDEAAGGQFAAGVDV